MYNLRSTVTLGDITSELTRLKAGTPEGWQMVIPKVYDELRRLAAARLSHESENHTLQPTELVHEAYMRLIHQRQVDWASRTHFFGVAAQLMRLILIDYARRGSRAKRTTPAWRVDVSFVDSRTRTIDLEALDQALDRLTQVDPRQSLIVEMRYFGGLTVDETAAELGISPKTVRRDWNVARAWLYGELHRESRES
ncbi:MAG: sigma-70 family RNA polymerase sigma factor [Acidobacteria bacterium]|nr:sigma-70 family RNA polymerase sigma factor [Acidobacteriota bacterium]